MSQLASSLNYGKTTSYQPLGFNGHPWQPGLRRAPYAGLAGLLTALVGILVSISILVLSNGKSVVAWRFQPTVYLAIASTITNIMLAYAHFQGIAITWWQTALKDGTTIGDLHKIWDYGNNFQSAILAGRRVNMVAVASVLVALSPINGPLLQRASTFGQVNVETSRLLDLRMSNLVPRGYTAIVTSRGDYINALRANFSTVAGDYYNNVPIHFASQCSGKCAATVVGAGFHASCQEYTVPYNVSSNNRGYSDYPVVFGTNVEFSVDQSALINISAQYKPSNGCLGQLRVQNCTLQGGTVAYPVTVDGPGGSISLSPSTDIWDDVQIGNPDSLQPETHLDYFSTYGGLALALENDWTTSLELNWNAVIGYQMDGQQSKETIAHTKNLTSTLDCGIYFTDPMPDFLAAARELMFRTAVASANSTTPLQRVTSQEYTTPLTYHTNFVFLALATVASIIPLLAVLATYQRFWVLGRACSLSPIETAKAFNAPALRGSDSNAPISSLIKKVGTRPIKYGVVGGGIATADTTPVFDSKFQTGHTIEMSMFQTNTGVHSDSSEAPKRRLELADPIKTAPVRADETFRD